MRSKLDEFSALAGEAGKTLAQIIEEQTGKGSRTLPLTELAPDTRYVACAFGVSVNGQRAGTLFKETFATSMPAEIKRIDIDIVQLTKHSVSVEFSPSTDLLTYYGSIIDRAYFDEVGSDEKNLQDDLEYFALLAENSGKNVSQVIAENTRKGKQTLPFNDLKPATSYYAYAFGVNTDGSVTSILFKELFITPEPGPSDNRITLNVSNIGIDGALISATTTNDDPYVLDVWEASKLQGMTDDEIIRTLLASYDGYDIDKDIVMHGNDQIDATGQIDPTETGTECIALAFGYEAGYVTTALVKEEFKTRPGDWVDCDFTFERISLTSRTASFKVTVRDSEGRPDTSTPYFFSIISAEEYARIGNSQEALGAYVIGKIQEEADYWGYQLESYIKFALFYGEHTEEFSELIPSSEFHIIAAGVNTKAKVITQVSLSEKYVVPAPSSATVTFGDPVISGNTVTVPVQAGTGTPKWKAAGMASTAQYMSDTDIISHLLSEFVEENTVPQYVFDSSYDDAAYFFAIGIDASGNPGNLVKLVVPLGN